MREQLAAALAALWSLNQYVLAVHEKLSYLDDEDMHAWALADDINEAADEIEWAADSLREMAEEMREQQEDGDGETTER